jgi:hypothetical protein
MQNAFDLAQQAHLAACSYLGYDLKDSKQTHFRS